MAGRLKCIRAVTPPPLPALACLPAARRSSEQLQKIHDYVAAGGTLLIDPRGGSPAFLKSILVDFLPHALPDQTPDDIRHTDAILAGTGEGMTRVDLTTALLGTDTWPVNGYTPETAHNLLRNILLFALEK